MKLIWMEKPSQTTSTHSPHRYTKLNGTTSACYSFLFFLSFFCHDFHNATSGKLLDIFSKIQFVVKLILWCDVTWCEGNDMCDIICMRILLIYIFVSGVLFYFHVIVLWFKLICFVFVFRFLLRICTAMPWRIQTKDS